MDCIVDLFVYINKMTVYYTAKYATNFLLVCFVKNNFWLKRYCQPLTVYLNNNKK